MKLLDLKTKQTINSKQIALEKRLNIILSLCIVLAAVCIANAQSFSFTYQGKLNDNGFAANGTYEMQFALYDAAANGNQIGSTITNASVVVTQGIFTVSLNFGGTAFSGPPRYLEMAVRPQGNPNPYTALGPRQAITSAPYAVRSLSSANADNAANSAKLGGIDANQYVLTGDSRMTDPRDPLPGSASYIQNTTTLQSLSNFNISGSGSANSLNSATNFQIGGVPVLKIHSNTNLYVGRNTGSTSNLANTNAFFGDDVGPNNTGFANSFFGNTSGYSNTTGIGNSFFGASSGASNSNGTQNAFFGSGTGQNSTTGRRNSFFGAGAGNLNGTGFDNSYFGESAGLVSIGSWNSFFGRGAGINNTFGSENAFFGYGAGEQNTQGGVNTFIGVGAGHSNTFGGSNSFVGYYAGRTNTTGNYNVTVGFGADVGAGDLFYAAAIGAQAVVTQSNSLVLGRVVNVNGALDPTNVGIGTTAPKARFHIADHNGNILFGNGGCNPGFAAIGFATTLNCNNYSLLGNGTDTILNRPTGGSIIFRQNNVNEVSISAAGILSAGYMISVGTLGSAGNTPLCRNGFNQISNCSSSLRYKKNINPFTTGLSLVKQLKPITFDWKDGGMHDLGLGAEEVAKVNEHLVIRNDKGEVEGVKYDRIGVVLINAIKEQQRQIELQQNQIQELQKHVFFLGHPAIRKRSSGRSRMAIHLKK